jgi:hypothetical protein
MTTNEHREVEAVSLPQGDAEALMEAVKSYGQARAETALFNAKQWPSGLPIGIPGMRLRHVRALASRLAAPASIPDEPMGEPAYYAHRIERCLDDDQRDHIALHRKFLADTATTIRELLAAAPEPQPAGVPQQAQAEPLTETYVQRVPDHCDRILWRGLYYSLPISPSAPAAQPAPEIESNPMGGAVLRGEAASKFREAMNAPGVKGDSNG